MSFFKSKQETPTYFINFDEAGVSWSAFATDRAVKCESNPNPMLEILRDEGLVEFSGSSYKATWQSVYDILKYNDVNFSELGLPRIKEVAPTIESNGTLTDKDFGISITDWREINGLTLGLIQLTGAAFKKDDWYLLPEASWKLKTKILDFWKRPEKERTHELNRQSWSRIREMAISANAEMMGFLYKSVVITPEKLRIDLKRGDALDTKVIEVIPSFNECPENWLDEFDKQKSVPDEYVLPSSEGIVQILLKPEVKAVLKQIKQMPGRRAAGQRAEAFVINPFATLGEDASQTIDIEQFEKARENAGLQFDRFYAWIVQSPSTKSLKIGIMTVRGGNASAVEYIEFETDEILTNFINKVEKNMTEGLQLICWNDYEFEILGDTPTEIQSLKDAVKKKNQTDMVAYEAVYDISNYAERISEIGEQPFIYSPYIAKAKDDEGWFTSNLFPIISVKKRGSEESQVIQLTPIIENSLKEGVEHATINCKTEFSISQFPDPIPTADARHILEAFDAFSKAEPGEDFKKPKTSTKRPTLVIKPNIKDVEYDEGGKTISNADKQNVILPLKLKSDCKLLEHQLVGIAQMQHLYRLAPNHCRGVILADDMGLGKTLQTLTFIASILEIDKQAPPALIVAPVSLLENWKNEIEKFFLAGSIPYLMAYGSKLNNLKVSKSNIDEQLLNIGLVRFLKEKWIGDAKIVLTTYETLRDLEFSFAAEKWSVMVCDEAQKIKNPNALVTRAALKQNVTFKIACTGTPVENTLADLWCLFDFIQPGFLGPLNDFAQNYRRPIEARLSGDPEKMQRVEELRKKIEPQIIRRMKNDIALDLPKKKFDEECKNVPMSSYQVTLYTKAIDSYNRRKEPGVSTPFKNKLMLLQYLRAICIDPRPFGGETNTNLGLKEYCAQTPKMGWLLNTLEAIKNKGDKAIVFCEFRSIQKVLRHYITLRHGVSPDIINGETEATASASDSRQKRIEEFQKPAGFGVIILSPIAVGFGVNIQKANHVIHYTRHWNPAKEDQATDRAYRIGQTKEVIVYTPVMTANFNTFEQKLDSLLAFKKSLSSDMLNGCGAIDPNDLDLSEIVPADLKCEHDDVYDIDELQGINALFFEALVAALWGRKGYAVYRTPDFGDSGVDVVAIKDKSGVLIQCKVSVKQDNYEPWDAIKEVVAGKAYYEQRHKGISFELCCATNNFFNDNAKKHAKLNNVTLVEKPYFLQEMKRDSLKVALINNILESGHN